MKVRPKIKIQFQMGKINLQKADSFCWEGPQWMEEAILAYFRGESYVPDNLNVSEFTRRVLLEMANIPFGHTVTYSELAEKIGAPGAARAVGSACGNNPYPLFIPCHRVVSRTGIGGFSQDIDIKRHLLEYEQLA